MNHAELEKIVYELVEQVLKDLPPEILSKLVSKNDPSTQNNSHLHRFGKALVIEEDLRQLHQQGIRELLIAPKAIVTPAATDFAHSRGLKINRESNLVPQIKSGPSNSGQSAVGILISGCNDSERNTLLNHLNQLNLSFTEYVPGRESGQNLQETVKFLAHQIANGIHPLGIVLHEDAFSLSIQARKIEKIKPVVYWDASSIKKRNDNSANLLFLNPKVHRLKGLNEAVREWLGSRIGNK
ncbi:hypothetical protein JW964_18380 [candidate division KSB1 bacterium]|nr:hypothetical protein [candidate division KSB1 bacterium]